MVATKYHVLSNTVINFPEEMDTGSGNLKIQIVIMDVNGHKVGLFNTHLAYQGDFEDLNGPQLGYLCDLMNSSITNGDCEYAIGTGDFNTWDNPKTRTLITGKNLQMCNLGAFGEFNTWDAPNYVDNSDLITNPENPTGSKIPKAWTTGACDNIIVSPNISIQQVGRYKLYDTIQTGMPLLWDYSTDKPIILSDHMPFWADLKLL